MNCYKHTNIHTYISIQTGHTHHVLLFRLGQGDHGQGSNLRIDDIHQIGNVVQHQRLTMYVCVCVYVCMYVCSSRGSYSFGDSGRFRFFCEGSLKRLQYVMHLRLLMKGIFVLRELLLNSLNCACTYVCMYVNVSIYVNMHVYMYVYMYVFVFLLCIDTYIHFRPFSAK